MSAKPKILVAMDTMMCGGIEKSLLSLLNALDSSKVDITLILNEQKGLFMKFIPEWVNVHKIAYNKNISDEKKLGRKQLLKKNIRNLRLFYSLKQYLSLRKESRLQEDDRLIHRCRRYHNGIIDDNILSSHYDLAVAYANIEQMILVCDKISAKRKIAFFHTELDGLTKDINRYCEIFSKFDTLYCVSEDLTLSLKNKLPNFNDRIKHFPHIFNIGMIKEWAEKFEAEWKGNGFRLLSVGRVQHQKGFDLIPDIAHNLRKSNINFQWLIIGDGPMIKDISKRLTELDVYNCVTFCGIKENPYPYFASCDIYIQPSRYEGYCLTVAEARVFARPIIATRFDGANEQLEGGICGKIVDCDINQLSIAIKELVDNPNLRAQYSKALIKQRINDTSGADIFMEDVKKSLFS